MVIVEIKSMENVSGQEGGNRKRGKGWTVGLGLSVFIKDPPHSYCLRAL